jgi:hypothetical protein
MTLMAHGRAIDRAQEPERARALPAIDVAVAEHGQAAAHHERRAEPLQGAAGEQHGLVLREDAQERGGQEDQGPGQERAAAPVAIGQDARRHQEAGARVKLRPDVGDSSRTTPAAPARRRRRASHTPSRNFGRTLRSAGTHDEVTRIRSWGAGET